MTSLRTASISARHCAADFPPCTIYEAGAHCSISNEI